MVGIWYSFTLLISYKVLIHLKWQSSSFGCIEIPNFDGSNDIFPGPDYRKEGNP